MSVCVLTTDKEIFMRFARFFCAAFALALFTGCAAQTAEIPSAATAASPAVSSSQQTVRTDAELESQLDTLVGGDYTALRAFADANIQAAPEALADRMVYALMDASRAMLNESNDFIYGTNSAEIQKILFDAYGGSDGKMPRHICAEDKQVLQEKTKSSAELSALQKWFNSGLCLLNAEGSYYFALDLPEYEAAYAAYTSDGLADYLHIGSTETTDPLTNEEILAVSPEELSRRAVSYERFLAQHSTAPYAGDVRILLNVAVYKLVIPSYTDNLLDESGRVRTTMLTEYSRLAAREDCPAVQLAAQGTLESIAASPNGIVAENGLPSDDFTENAMQRSEQVQHKLDELYGALEK